DAEVALGCRVVVRVDDRDRLARACSRAGGEVVCGLDRGRRESRRRAADGGVAVLVGGVVRVATRRVGRRAWADGVVVRVVVGGAAHTCEGGQRPETVIYVPRALPS